MIETCSVYLSQCTCGHIFLERYSFKQPTDKGVIGFCWCGFCRTRVNIIPRTNKPIKGFTLDLKCDII